MQVENDMALKLEIRTFFSDVIHLSMLWNYL